MKDDQVTGNYYTLGHIVQFTGLTDRTLRNYISMGLLIGEKINNIWHFTPEQVEAFVKSPSVRPSILAKKNALVYDFLLDDKKKSEQCCIILDIPGVNEKEASEFFCYSINDGTYQNIHFSFDSAGYTPRVILKGDASEVLKLVNNFYHLNS